MAKFVQIGGTAINLDLIESIEFGEHYTRIYFSDSDELTLNSEESERFKAWWECIADFEVIP